MQNFYSESIQFINRNLNGPLADNGLAYYYYRILDSLAIDNRPVYKILVTPDDSLDPGFTGALFITADTYDLLKVELGVNAAADKNGITDSVRIFQQFAAYGNEGIMMPVDYRLDIKINLLGIIKIGFDANTVLSEYALNVPINDGFFDKAVISVKTDADKKDSLYWNSIQMIPATAEEETAYREIDSTENAPKTFWETNSILDDRWALGKHYSITAPVGTYSFNRVAGHSFNVSVAANNILDNRLNTEFHTGYGLQDKRWKGLASAEYKMGEYRTSSVSFRAFRQLLPVLDDGNYSNDWFGALLTLCSKTETNHYYYSDGFSVKLESEVLPVLRLLAGFSNATDRSAKKNTDYSFFRKNVPYKANDAINPMRRNELSLGFQIDFRDYVEDGLYRRRIRADKGFMIFSADYIISDKGLGSERDYQISKTKLYGYIPGFGETGLNFTLDGFYANKGLPWQRMNALQGSGDGIIGDQSFRTFWFNQYFGDRSAEMHLNYNFSDSWLRVTGISFLKSLGIGLNTFVNAALLSTSAESREFSVKQSKEFLHPIYEAGFGVSYPKFPLSFEFTWRLNYREGNPFKVGINAVMR